MVQLYPDLITMYSKHAASIRETNEAGLNFNHILQESEHITGLNDSRSLRYLKQKQEIPDPQNALDEILPSKLNMTPAPSYSRRLAESGMLAYTDRAQKATQRRYQYNVQQSHTFAPKSFISNLGRKWASLPKLDYKPSVASTSNNHQQPHQQSVLQHSLHFQHADLSRPHSDMLINVPLSRPNTPVRPFSDSNSNFVDMTIQSAREYQKYLEKRRNRGRTNILNLTEDDEDEMFQPDERSSDKIIQNDIVSSVVQPNRDIEIVPFPAISEIKHPLIENSSTKTIDEDVPSISLKLPIKVNVKIQKQKQQDSAKGTPQKKQFSKFLKHSRVTKQISESVDGESNKEKDLHLSDEVASVNTKTQQSDALPEKSPEQANSQSLCFLPREECTSSSAPEADELPKRRYSQDGEILLLSPIHRNERNLLCDQSKISTPPLSIEGKGTEPSPSQIDNNVKDDVPTNGAIGKQDSDISGIAITGSKVGSKPKIGVKPKRTKAVLLPAKKKQEAEAKTTKKNKEPAPSGKTKASSEKPKAKAGSRENSETDNSTELSSSQSSSILKRKGDKKSKKKKSVQFGPKFVREVTKITYPWNEESSDSESGSSYEDSDDEDEEDRIDELVEKEIQESLKKT